MALSRFFANDNDTDFFANPFRALMDPRFAGPSLLAGHQFPHTESAPIKLDVYEKEDRFLVKADVPGIPKERVQLSVDGDLLNLAVDNETGQDKTEEVQGIRIHRSERSSVYSRRTIRLPDSADTERITARVDNGVLDVDIPKKHMAQQRRRQINILDNDVSSGQQTQLAGSGAPGTYASGGTGSHHIGVGGGAPGGIPQGGVPQQLHQQQLHQPHQQQLHQPHQQQQVL